MRHAGRACGGASGATAIYLGRRLLAGSSALPAADAMRAASWLAFRRVSPHIWACWRWGLPCHDRHRPRGALLPHHFTLACEPHIRSVTCDDRRAIPSAVYFLWHFPGHCCRWPLATTVPCPVRTFLPVRPKPNRAAARPALRTEVLYHRALSAAR